MAIENAKESLEKKFQLMEKNEAATLGAIQQLGELLHMKTPHIIELFDNSNIQGAYAVAGMVVLKMAFLLKRIIVNLKSKLLMDLMIMEVCEK